MDDAIYKKFTNAVIKYDTISPVHYSFNLGYDKTQQGLIYESAQIDTDRYVQLYDISKNLVTFTQKNAKLYIEYPILYIIDKRDLSKSKKNSIL